MLSLYDFSVDYVRDPHFISRENLRFGWKLRSDQTNVLQKTYRIMIADANGICADTDVVTDTRVCDITIPQLKLVSRTDYTVTVTVTDNHKESATLSHTVTTELAADDWADAKWISAADCPVGWAPFLRKKFHTANVKKAVLFACGLGCAEYYINGHRVDEGYYVDPPASNYESIVYYRRFDVTDLVKTGGNAIAALLGEGFYAQSRAWDGNGKLGLAYGRECLKCKLFLELADGITQTVVSDIDWQSKPSPITVNNIYGGEQYDARLITDDFALFEGDDCGWGGVVEDTVPKGTLTPAKIPPVKEIRRLSPIEAHTASGLHEGVWIFDFGENIAGVIECKLPPAPAGAVCVFRFAETLTPAGTLDQRSTGSAILRCVQQDTYVYRGEPQGETYRTALCYHGFRYVEVAGLYRHGDLDSPPDFSMISAIQLCTAFQKTANFSTSYTDLDRFNRVMANTYVSNFHGFPEDCPVRERCGWLGDAQLVCDWGLLHYDTAACYEKYLEDIRTTREIYGTWQQIAPGKRTCGGATPLWECAQIFIPYALYRYCGDATAVLAAADAMKALIEREKGKSENYIISSGLGDWIPAVRNGSPRRMPVSHSSTMVFYEMCTVMAQLCDELHIGDSDYYRALAENIKRALNHAFYDFDTHSYGYWGSDGVALKIGVYPDGEKELLTQGLIRRIDEDNYEMATGIYGNKYLTAALLEAGAADTAFAFLFNRHFPSFGTMMDGGATTIWEAPYMHGIEPDRNFFVSSYNHPMHGGFLYTCITHIAGITPTKPGFAAFRFKPCFTDKTQDVCLSLDTVYGTVNVEIHGKHATLTVPAGTVCTIDIPVVSVNGAPYVNGTPLGSGTYEIEA